MSDQVFSRIVSLEQFAQMSEIKLSNLSVAKTTNGSLLLVTKTGGVVGTIQNKLKGSTLAETAAKIQSSTLCVGIPHTGSVDDSGRPSLPCLMEGVTSWETLDLF